MVVCGGLAALGVSEPVLGVQGQAGCDSQRGRQGIHFPKKSKVSSVPPNPSPWGHSRGLGGIHRWNNAGLPWNNNTTNPGTPLVATSCPAPPGFSLGSDGEYPPGGGKGAKRGTAARGRGCLIPPGLLVVQGRKVGLRRKTGSPSPKSRCSPAPQCRTGILEAAGSSSEIQVGCLDSPAWIAPPVPLVACKTPCVLIQAGTQPGNSQSRVGVVA